MRPGLDARPLVVNRFVVEVTPIVLKITSSKRTLRHSVSVSLFLRLPQSRKPRETFLVSHDQGSFHPPFGKNPRTNSTLNALVRTTDLSGLGLCRPKDSDGFREKTALSYGFFRIHAKIFVPIKFHRRSPAVSPLRLASEHLFILTLTLFAILPAAAMIACV
jgi:hypothetical protein